MQFAIETQQLTKRFGAFCALDRCTLAVPAGKVWGLLGPNGAGKSTLIRLLMGFLTPSDGEAFLGGKHVIRERVAAHHEVSYLPSSPKFFRSMSGRGVLKFFSRMRPDGDFEQALKLTRRLDLDTSRWVAFMSTGMRQKLAIAVAFSNRAPILILDEPTENLDPNIRREVVALVREAQGEGRTVLFSSHVLSEVEEVADQVAILRAGELVHQQPLHDLRFCHRIVARAPSGLQGLSENPQFVKINQGPGDAVSIEVEGDLANVLPILSAAQLSDVYIEATGLQTVYDRFHQPLTHREDG
ncbi:MAG: ABC transporter ATP-binding protein [Pirellulaceae bacterium]|nr:ABC transporter ATP-binding protein [Pirellulaceae bacterium]